MGVRPITSSHARSVCHRSGVQGKLAGEQLIRLRDIEQTLIQSIRDAEAAIDSEQFWGRAAVTASFAKIGCDLAISAMSMLPGAGVAGTAVSMIYDRASLVTDILNAPENGGAIIAQALGEARVDALSRSLGGKAGNLIDASKALIKAQIAVDSALADAKANRSGGDGIAAARRTILVQLEKIRVKIHQLEKQIADCGLQ